MKNPSRVRLFGPLQEFGPGFVGELERLGYSSPSSRRSDYADPNQPNPPTTTHSCNPPRHNPNLGIVNVMPTSA